MGYYLSFGKGIFQPLKGAVLIEIPIEKIFFETDDTTMSIKNIYEQAAKILGITLSSLQFQIKKNSIQLFAGAFIKNDN